MNQFDAPLPIEIEIRAEKADALARAASAFEYELERLRAFEKRLSAVPLSDRATLAAEHHNLRRKAARRLWCLIVHREALGLRRHESLYQAYQIPAALLPNP